MMFQRLQQHGELHTPHSALTPLSVLEKRNRAENSCVEKREIRNQPHLGRSAYSVSERHGWAKSESGGCMVRGSALCIGRIRSLHLRELSMHASCSTVYRATQYCPSELSPKISRRARVLKHAVQGNMGDLCLIAIVIAQLDLTVQVCMHLCRAACSR
jgi:hypothetical protein